MFGFQFWSVISIWSVICYIILCWRSFTPKHWFVIVIRNGVTLFNHCWLNTNHWRAFHYHRLPNRWSLLMQFHRHFFLVETLLFLRLSCALELVLYYYMITLMDRGIVLLVLRTVFQLSTWQLSLYHLSRDTLLLWCWIYTALSSIHYLLW